MSDRRRLLALSALHTLLTASVVVLPVRALVAYAGSTIHPVIGFTLLAYLAFVTTCTTRHAISKLPQSPRSLVDAYITTGVRWGSIGGALYAGGILVLPFIWATKIALFGPHTGEYNLVGGQWAFVWMMAIPFFASIFLGAILGGAISLVDRTLLAIAHWTRARSRNETSDV